MGLHLRRAPHRAAQLLDRVESLKRANRKLLARGYAVTVAALALLGVDAPTSYDASGALTPAGGSLGLLDARA